MKKRVLANVLALFLATALSVTGCGSVGVSFGKDESDDAESLEEASDEASQDASEEEEDSGKESDEDQDEDSKDNSVKLGNNADEERLLSKVVKEDKCAPEDAREYVIGDLDGDGSVEGFVYVGDEYDDYNEYFGCIYFVSDDSCEMIHGLCELRPNSEGKVFGQINLGKRTLFTFNESYTTDTMTFAYFVKDGAAVETSISEIGYIFQREGSDDIVISVGMYDHSLDYEKDKEDEGLWTGHTWKNYYFYYDESLDDFREYGGYEISEEELNQIVGFDLSGEIKAGGYTIDAIYERGNGIVNVNYSYVEGYEDQVLMASYENVSYDEKQGRFLDVSYDAGDDRADWLKSSFGGIYRPAYREDMATYDRYSR